MNRSLNEWFDHLKKILPKGTRVSVSIKVEGQKTYIVTFWSRMKSKDIVVKSQREDIASAINEAGSTLYQNILKENTKWKNRAKKRMLVVSLA